MVNTEVSKEKLENYFNLTSTALKIVKEKIVPGHEEDAKEIIDMVENYLSDAEHFESKGNFVLAFGALNYSHGWIDAGVRLGIFDVHDDKLFTVK